MLWTMEKMLSVLGREEESSGASSFNFTWLRHCLGDRERRGVKFGLVISIDGKEEKRMMEGATFHSQSLLPTL